LLYDLSGQTARPLNHRLAVRRDAPNRFAAIQSQPTVPVVAVDDLPLPPLPPPASTKPKMAPARPAPPPTLPSATSTIAVVPKPVAGGAALTLSSATDEVVYTTPAPQRTASVGASAGTVRALSPPLPTTTATASAAAVDAAGNKSVSKTSVRALFSCEGDDDAELSFEAGDIIRDGACFVCCVTQSAWVFLN
jgi:hypothetical protein